MANNMNGQLNTVIEMGNFKLPDILNKIDIFFANDQLSADQRVALIEKARTKANPGNAYPDIETRMTNLELMYRDLKEAFEAFKAEFDEPTEGDTSGDTGTEDVIPEYVQPSGAHDAYMIGDKVIENGKIYESVIDGNVWSPSAYPAGWKYIEDAPVVEEPETVEETTENTEEVEA